VSGAGLRRAGSGAALGGAALAALCGLALFVHHGIGPVRNPLRFHWYEPRGFLFRWAATGWLTEDVTSAALALGLPALGLAAAAWLLLRSALVRLGALWAVLFLGLCLYYGIEAAGVWRFFHWRGSAVMALLALVVAAAAAAPVLASSWERLAWPARVLLYLPLALAALALMRNATGTDQSLRFALSPWPVVPVFGLEIAAPVAGLALGAVALARAALGGRAGPLGLALASLAALGLAALGVLWWARAGASADWRLPAAAAGLAALALAAASAKPAAGAPGRHAALGALLVALPILVGMALVERDYTFTRDQRARLITDALQRFYEREQRYPDRLEELVAAGLLPEVPVPRVGFRWIDPQPFVYQNFGISYLLEFSAPRWVQCAYNPPYLGEDVDEDDAEEEDAAEADGDESLPGSWSCPSKPPELW
jgi:hypothetical protein